MTTLREAAQQALDALEYHQEQTRPIWSTTEAIEALKAALAEPVEPVAWRFKPMIGSPWSLSDDGYYISCMRDKGYIVEPLYAAPVQRKPLSDEEIENVWKAHVLPGFGERQKFYSPIIYARAIEAAHGIESKT